MKIAYLYQPGRINRLEDLKHDKVPTEFFYGAPELESRGHEIRYVEVYDEPAKNKIRIAFELLIKPKYLPAKVYFSHIAGVKKILHQLSGVDVIVATTPGIAFSLALLTYIGSGKLETPFIAIHCGVLNYSQNNIRLFLSRILFRKMHTVLYGSGERDSMQKIFKIPDSNISVNNFGVDQNFWFPVKENLKEDYILSVGNDLNRDYESLIEAANRLSRPVKILTKRELQGILPNNVDKIKGSWHSQALTDIELRDLYRKAFCVIVPLHDSLQPSGQSVTLQAMACGTPVILSRTSGLWDTIGLKDKDNIIFIKPKSIDDLINAVLMLANDSDLVDRITENGLKYTKSHGNITQFADTMEKLCRQNKLKKT